MKKSRNTDVIKHLYSRASFGINYKDLERISRTSVRKALNKLLRDAENPEMLNAATEVINRPAAKENPTEEDIRTYTKKRKEQEDEVNIAWITRLSETKAPLLEKLTLFWHGHFACRTNNGFYNQQLNNVQRKNALGNFRTMLVEVSQTPAMLSFLNNQQNKKGKPNENFARELMELFTLGRGNYTENDIKSSARAFTGWQFRGKSAEYFFNEKQHDEGQKSFFGETGNFNGEDIIDIILKKKQTAYFIAEKLCKFFVNDNPKPAYVKELGDHFYDSKYEIRPLIEKLFTADWFYAPENMGNKIKSPVELLIGLNKQFYVTFEKPKVLLQLQRSMGQMLFYPPNVAGWPGGQSWIDSSSLLTRLKLPSTILNGGVIETEGKADPEDEAYLASARRTKHVTERKLQTRPDWDRFVREHPSNVSNGELAYILLSGNIQKESLLRIDISNPINMAIQIVSTPEYQLC